MPAPYVKSTVEDQSTRVESTGSVYAGIVINALKGPVNTPYLITNQTQLLRVFTPNGRLELGYDTAYYDAYFLLRDMGKIWVVRAANDNVAYGGAVIKDATSENDNAPISNPLIVPDDYVAQADDLFLLHGNTPGKYNNDIEVEIITDQTIVRLENAFKIRVLRKGTNNILEEHTVSLNPGLLNGYGTNCFIETALTASNYIRAISFASPKEDEDGNVIKDENGYDIYPTPKAGKVVFAKGSDGTTSEGISGLVDTGNRIKALKTLANTNDISLQLLLDGGCTETGYPQAMFEVAAARDEATFCLLSTPTDLELADNAMNKIKQYRDSLSVSPAWCGGLYTPHQKMYDEFNDRYIYASPSAFVAGAMAKSAEDYGWHWPAAGYTRGVLNTIDVAKAFLPSEVDYFSDNQINTLIKDPGSGIVIIDQQTLRNIASDMQEVSIACLVNLKIRPELKSALKGYIYELNDEDTRRNITTMCKTYMESIKADRGVYDYRIICNEANNTDDDIQNNRLNVWVYIKPTKPAKFITQKIVITPYSVNFDDLIV